MTRSTTSITISPMREAASSTARWRARAISTSALPTMRSYSPCPRAWASVRTCSAVRLAVATISRACWRASSSTLRRSSSAASASARALSAASRDYLIFSWRSSIALLMGGSTHL